MTTAWTVGAVPLKFALSDLTLFSCRLQLLRRTATMAEPPLTARELSALSVPLDRSVRGAIVWSQPIDGKLPEFVRTADYLIYVPRQYDHFYVDLTIGRDKYLQRFSARSRSTLKRKVRKFAELDGGRCHWRAYRSSAEIVEFYTLARRVSAVSYQERLLGAGLPAAAGYLNELREMADAGRVIGYLLFQGQKPVAYLLCPIESDQAVIYGHVGFDPAYRALSPGTVLLALVLEALLDSGRYRIFDFTEGEAEHKRYFSTNSYRSADIFIFRRSLPAWLITRTHWLTNRFSESLGRLFARLGLKRHIRRWLRR
jgi:hypothetical protein